MWSYRAPCTSQHRPGNPLRGCTKALLPQIFLHTTEKNEVTLGLTVPNRAAVVKPTLCCVHKISASCQLSPEGSVTLHPAEICSVHGTRGWAGKQPAEGPSASSPARSGWVRPTLHAQLCISCLTHHRLSAGTAFQATISALYKMSRSNSRYSCTELQ